MRIGMRRTACGIVAHHLAAIVLIWKNGRRWLRACVREPGRKLRSAESWTNATDKRDWNHAALLRQIKTSGGSEQTGVCSLAQKLLGVQWVRFASRGSVSYVLLYMVECWWACIFDSSSLLFARTTTMRRLDRHASRTSKYSAGHQLMAAAGARVTRQKHCC